MRAIVGARPDKSKNDKNTIWGWGEIARMTANNPQFKDQFYDARYNLALCRYNYALAQTRRREKERAAPAPRQERHRPDRGALSRTLAARTRRSSSTTC